MKPCPFCGEIDKHPLITNLKKQNTYVYSHFCSCPELKVVITVYGDTESEVVRRWNGRAEDGKEHITE